MEPDIYQIHHLKHAYQDQPVLDIHAMSIRPAAIVGIIGPNGSGKSTFLKLLAFVEKPCTGEIVFKGKPAMPFSDAVRFRVTLLTQEPYLMKRSVYQNIAYGLQLRGQIGDIRDRIYQALRWVGLPPEDFGHRRWYELSGGEAQRVALAARLVLRPEVLLMDEPTASVDAASVQLIKDAALRARRQWGTTLVIASHDWPWLYEICDEVRHLFTGRFFGTGGENIVFGPWQPVKTALWGKHLPDGQTIAVPKPPDPKAVAVMPAEAITISTEKYPTCSTDHVLHGVISRLIHEKRSGDIVVTILVDNMPFTAKVTREDLRRSDLYPGRAVFIHYEPRRVKWSN